MPPGAGSGSDAFGAPGGGPFREQSGADPFTDYDTGSMPTPSSSSPSAPNSAGTAAPGLFLPPPVGSPLGGTGNGSGPASPAPRGPQDTLGGGFESPFPPGGFAPGGQHAGRRSPQDTPAEGFASPFAPGGQHAAPRGPQDTPAGGFESPFAPDGFAPGGRHATPFGTEDFPPGVPKPNDPFAGDDTAVMPAISFDGAAPFASPAAPPPDDPFPGYQPPAGPTTGPATGSMQVPPAGQTGFRPPVTPGLPGSPGSPGSRPPVPGLPADGLSGDTVVSGIPAVPAGEARTLRPPAPRPVPAAPAAGSPSAAKSAPPKKKGRSKVTLLVVAAGGIVVVAYGVGLLMNHADVPKGTTVLGVDIGDQGKEQAVQTLDKAFGNRSTAPLNLTFGGHKVTLKPSVAGLSIDTDATVRGVAHTDYNPVSVVESLFGATRAADPVIVVDEDKLTAALKEVAGQYSTATEGMVRFEPNKIVPVPGKAGTSLDVNAAATQVSTAYRTRAATGVDAPIALKVITVQPKVTQAALDKAVSGFATRAMSGNVTVSAGSGHSLAFGPVVTFPAVLTMVADANGNLQPFIDAAALKPLYGTTFDGVLIKRSDGSKTPVTPEDIAAAMLPALDSTTNRSVTLANVAN